MLWESNLYFLYGQSFVCIEQGQLYECTTLMYRTIEFVVDRTIVLIPNLICTVFDNHVQSEYVNNVNHSDVTGSKAFKEENRRNRTDNAKYRVPDTNPLTIYNGIHC